jgi:hypothetical protein
VQLYTSTPSILPSVNNFLAELCKLQGVLSFLLYGLIGRHHFFELRLSSLCNKTQAIKLNPKTKQKKQKEKKKRRSKAVASDY